MQIIVNGVIAGCTVALAGLAFNLVYSTTRVFHIALGAICALAPFVAWRCLEAGLGWPIALVVAIIAGAALSIMIETVNHAILDRKGASPGIHFISSVAVYLVVVQALTLAWGSDLKSLRSGAAAVFPFWNSTVAEPQLWTLFASLVALSGVLGWARLTGDGLKLRAIADSPASVALSGHNVAHLRVVAFALSGAVGSVAALTTAYDVGFDPGSGLHITLLGIVAAIIGGRHLLAGPIVGGLLVGVVRSQVGWHFSAQSQEAATFGLLVAVLLLRPEGLISRRERVEVVR